MRLLFSMAGLTPESGGPSRSVPALASALAAHGVEIDIVSLDFGQKESLPLVPCHPQLKTHLIPCRTSRRLPTLWARRFGSTLNRIATGSGSLIHDTGAWLPTNHIAARFARQHHIPLVLSPRGMLSRWSLEFKSLRKKVAWLLYQKRALDSASLFHVTSAAEAEDIRALGFRQPVALIPNGVDIPEFSKKSITRSLRTVLFLSRIHPKKGLIQLIEAWDRLRPVGWRVIIAGPNESNHQADLQRLIDARGLQPCFSFVGAIDGQEKWNLYRDADLFVLPSHSENFGLVIAEALACGTPVITTKAAPWSELIDRRCGWWIDPNTGALASALQDALALSPQQRSEMGERGRELINSKYTWPAAARAMIAVYSWLLNGGPRPSAVLS